MHKLGSSYEHVRPSAEFVYCAKTVLDRAMKFGSIRESHAGIPDPLSLLGYDDNKGSKCGNPKMVAIEKRYLLRHGSDAVQPQRFVFIRLDQAPCQLA